MIMAEQDVVTRASVGITPERPFRFCTMHYDCSESCVVQPGDDAMGSGSPRHRSRRALICRSRRGERPHHVVPHRHDFYELVLVRAGTAVHACAHGEGELTRGDVLILTPAAVHAYSRVRGLVKTNIYVQPEWLLEDLQVLWGEKGLVRYLLTDALLRGAHGEDHLHLRLEEDEVSACEAEIEALTAEAMHAEPSLALYNACFLKLLFGFNGGFQRLEADAQRPLPVSRELWSVMSTVEALVRHSRPMQVEHLARRLGMTRFRLTRLFKEGAGISPMAYYQRRRIEHARRLVEDSDLNITEVACRYGYADAAHFTRHFKRALGESPTAWRARFQAGEEDTD